MACKPFLCLILLWTTALFAAADAAATTKISAEILNFVPSCAQACFESFILANFDFGECGSSPSMSCLCRQTGRSGYTIGEGGVSCIVAETSRGHCKGADASGQTTATAYNMCVGIDDAAPKTHSTIVATLVVPTGTGPLVVPTVQPTASSNPPTNDVTSTLALTTASPTTGGAPFSVTASQGAATSTALPEKDSTPSQQPLSSAEITGISLGCAAVVVFGILLVFLARCIRRRRYGDLETGFTRMRDSLSFGRKSQGNSPPVIQISNPIHHTPADRDFGRPGYQPRTQQPLGVGLAIIPSRTPPIASGTAATRTVQEAKSTIAFTPPSQSRTPKIERSPPKPALTLAIPNGQSQILRAPPITKRDSVVTEFAEDGEGESVSGNAPIWRPPPTDPQSATTYYAADKGGNWILRSKSTRKPQTNKPPVPAVEVELPSPEDKTKAERAQGFDGWFSPGAVVSPLRVPSRSTQQKLGSPIAFKEHQSSRETRSSSVYSPYSAPNSVTPGPDNPLPKNLPPPETYFEMIRGGRELTGTRSKRRSARKLGRRSSTGSTTSIESMAAPPFEDEDIIEDVPQVDLSPVTESPRTPSSPGRSPVTYPKIHNRSRQQQLEEPSGTGPGLRVFPAQSRPGPPRRRGEPDFTPGMVIPVKKAGTVAMEPASGPGRPMNAPALNPNPTRNPGQQRTGSPETRLGAMDQQRQRQQQEIQFSTRYLRGQQPTPDRRQDASSRPPYGLPGEGASTRQQQEYWGQPPQVQQEQQQQQQWWSTPQPQSAQSQSRPAPPQTPDTSAQNSLLAKRLGANKAATLALGGRDGEQSGLRKKKTGWQRENVEAPPVTPGIRMMTPTRKGDDLFLDVR